MAFDPTDEQIAAIDMFEKGESMVIEAGAGTGKTSTLELIARSTDRRGQYMAFNAAIVRDVAGRMPRTVNAQTAHALAMAHTGKRYRHRLDSGRMKGYQVAQLLGIGRIVIKVGDIPKTIGESYLGSLVGRTIDRFCQTVDETPGIKHVPYIDGIDIPNDDGTRNYENNVAIRKHIEHAIAKYWADILKTDGRLKFKHGHYLKMFQLERPVLPVDYVMFDEAQDANPVMAAIVEYQTHAQRIYVGDGAQAINEWMGAVDALTAFDTPYRSTLTQSFRFGPDIADVANRYLTKLGAPIRLSGLWTIDSTTGKLDDELDPDALLCRTNASAVSAMLERIEHGVRPHLVGGGGEVTSFAQAAQQLQRGEHTWHPDLACFDSWGEVRMYVENDPQGDELALLVKLIDDHGADVIVDALLNMPDERDATMVISTAHKAKGREWPVVKLDGDFAMFDEDTGERRLRYVACTRAQRHLDATVLDVKKVERPAPDLAIDAMVRGFSQSIKSEASS
jgi:hypothetical protein